MHLSMHTWMRDEPLARTARRLKAHGYGSVELSCMPPPADLDEARRTLREEGIACWSVVIAPQPPSSLAAADERLREDAVEQVRASIRTAAALDAEVVTVVPSMDGPEVTEVPPGDRWAVLVAGLRELYDDAERAGVRIALEPLNRFESTYLFRADQALALAHEVGPSCGLALDTFHLNIEEADPFETIRVVGDRLFNFHVGDTNRLACGTGHWNWPATLAALRDTGYDGGLVFEPVVPWGRTPVAPTAPTFERVLLQRPQEELSDDAYDLIVERTAATLLPLIG